MSGRSSSTPLAVSRWASWQHLTTPLRQGIKKSEAAKKQRELKKFGKQIQVEKLKQREMDKKSFTEKMHGIKRSEWAGQSVRGVVV